jgi:hypothetical protein
VPCIASTALIGQRVTADDQILRLLLPSLLGETQAKYLGLGYGRLSLASGIAAVLRLECRRHTAISVKSIRPRKRLKARTEREVIGLAACVRRRAHAGA